MLKSVLLHSTVSGQGPALILLHGLFGMGKNLSSIARGLSDRFQVHCLDLRNHGRSPHTDRMSFAEMAADILAYMDANDIAQSCLLGHSLGGKVAMQVALQSPQRVTKLVVADIAPIAYSGHHNDVFAGLKSVDSQHVSSRKEAQDVLQDHIADQGVQQFILKSLHKNPQGQFDWLMNIAALEQCYDQLRQAISNPTAFNGPVLFLKGEHSNYIQQNNQADILALFPHAQLKIIQNTGHWLHAEKPRLFIRLVRDFLLRAT